MIQFSAWVSKREWSSQISEKMLLLIQKLSRMNRTSAALHCFFECVLKRAANTSLQKVYLLLLPRLTRLPYAAHLMSLSRQVVNFSSFECFQSPSHRILFTGSSQTSAPQLIFKSFEWENYCAKIGNKNAKFCIKKLIEWESHWMCRHFQWNACNSHGKTLSCAVIVKFFFLAATSFDSLIFKAIQIRVSHSRLKYNSATIADQLK